MTNTRYQAVQFLYIFITANAVLFLKYFTFFKEDEELAYTRTVNLSL